MALVWVKIHNLPIVAFSKMGLTLITTKLGQPLMLDAYTSDMCLNPWGRNNYARALVEVSSKRDLVNSLVVAIPFKDGSRHSLETLEIEYEWKHPQCATCKVFDHKGEHCLLMNKTTIPNTSSGDGFIQVTPINKGHGEGANDASQALSALKILDINNENRDDCVSENVLDEVRNGKQGSNSLLKEANEALTSKPTSSKVDLEDDSDEDEVFLPDDEMSKYIS
ncbi:zinc knuckle CX2CX4HX4C containing protein [Tanacetum coccineum]